MRRAVVASAAAVALFASPSPTPSPSPSSSSSSCGCRRTPQRVCVSDGAPSASLPLVQLLRARPALAEEQEREFAGDGKSLAALSVPADWFPAISSASSPNGSNETKLELREELRDALFRAANEAKQRAHAPYSNFRVGCAVLCESGDIFVGTNVENASYGLTLCAERVALSNMVSGRRSAEDRPVLILVTTDVRDDFKWCCGACLSFMLEFGEDLLVASAKPSGDVEVKTLREQIPHAFSRADLEKPRV
jgi:cytidine deaminase